ncbi:TonB-dependent receptor [Sphingomonas colocasiae]|uniref:TonB-dependent receptor n=1 Tax=Sphingomonas colocasiae TaxID=1848973 RepID=A0ABS7PQV0_9SPHN|nr:TonB-dependent receptor [Sphingomonas colocasiae]MBY8823705.1 TonB-dependent receptor [Sphingomonas colocasiae]
MSRHIHLIALLTTTLLAAPAIAQETDTAPRDEGDIIVTAQRRESRLQDVPQAVSAFGGEALGRLGIRDTESLVRNTPSLTFTPVGPGESNIGLRGLSTDLGLAPAVAVYINDTPFDFRTDAYSGTPNIDLFDMQRVEVLRGPQGTLFGSSSTGGTIRYITNQPDPSGFAAHGEATVNSVKGGGEGYGAKAAVNLPLATNLALRVTGSYEKIAGYIDRYDATLAGFTSPQSNDKVAEKNANDAVILAVRAALRWEAASDLTITPSLFYQRIRADNPIATQSNLPGFGRASAVGGEPSHTNLLVANLTVEKEFGSLKLVSSSSYLNKKSDAAIDYTPLGYNIFGAFAPFESRMPGTADSYTQELRLTSSNAGPFNWIAGVYFSHTDQSLGQIFDGQPFSDLLNAEFGPAPRPIGPIFYDYLQRTSEQQIAGFAEVNYKLSDQLELIAGVRAYRLKNTLEATCTEAFPGILCGIDTPRITAKKTSASPRFTVNYRPSDNATLYATVSRGFRAGGANAAIPPALGCDLASSVGPIFNPDSVWNYELGAKIETPNRVLTVNGAAYRIEQKGIQLTIPDPCGSTFFANAGDARIDGAELEMNLRPSKHITLSGQISYTDAKFTSVPADFGAAAGYARGDAIPETPRWKFALSSELRYPVNEGWEAYARGSWQHVGKTPFGIDGVVSSGRFRPAYDIANFDIGAEGSSVDISLFVRNAFNKRGILAIGSGAVSTIPGVFENVTYVTPRTIGLTMRIKG